MRHRLFYLALIVVPLAAFFPALQSQYGQSTDYTVLRLSQIPMESMGESWAAVGETVLYRALLDSSFQAVSGPETLWLLRLFSISLLILLGILLWRQLDTSGWPEADAAAAGLLIVLLPAAQVTAAWAVCWPRAMAMLFAVAGFAAVEAELEAGGLKRAVAMVGGVFIYALAAMIRPELAFFALVPLIAVYLFRIRKTATSHSEKQWVTLHLLVLGTGYVVGRLLEYWAGEEPLFSISAMGGALTWLAVDAVPGAAALVPLHDDGWGGAWYFWPVAIAVIVAIVRLFRMDPSHEGQMALHRAKGGLMLAGVFIIAVLLAGGLSPRGYRDGYPLAAIVVVMLVAGWKAPRRMKKIKRWMHAAGLVAPIAIAAAFSYFHVATLIAEPQSAEWRFIRSAVATIPFRGEVRIAVVAADPERRLTDRRFRDEFGVRSTADEVVLRDMIGEAVRLRFPAGLPGGASYRVTVGANQPSEAEYDALIDLRRLLPAES